MARVFTAPDAVPDQLEEPVQVFLAGSIEQNKATRWQDMVIDEIDDLQVAVFNPRREEWDASWSQDGNPQLVEQINWELDLLDRARIVFFFLEPGTLSPISLMELGYKLGEGYPTRLYPMIVVCPPGFWRRTNVQVMCERDNVKLVETLGEGIEILRDTIIALHQQLAH